MVVQPATCTTLQRLFPVTGRWVNIRYFAINSRKVLPRNQLSDSYGARVFLTESFTRDSALGTRDG